MRIFVVINLTLKIMRHKFILSILIFLPFWFQAQVVNIPDQNFRNALIAGNTAFLYHQGDGPLDANGDGIIQQAEADNVKKIYVPNKNISSLEGIASFTNLEILICSNNELTSLDVSSNTELVQLDCNINQLSVLDVSANAKLEFLSCGSNQLTFIDISSNTKLKSFGGFSNLITNLTLNALPDLENFNIQGNQLTSLELPQLESLNELSCSNNQLDQLNVSHLANLERLSCINNDMTSLNVSQLEKLKYIDCRSNKLTSLDVSTNVQLKELICRSNQLTSLTVDGLSELRDLDCRFNELISLDLSNCSGLEKLFAMDNNLSNLGLSGCSSLKTMDVRRNKLFTIDFTSSLSITWVILDDNELTSLDLSGLSELVVLSVKKNALESLDLSPSPALRDVIASYNKFEHIDVSMCPVMQTLHLDYNTDLVSLNIRNGGFFSYSNYNVPGFRVTGSNNLKYVCVDPGEANLYYQITNNPNDLIVSSYCDFTNGSDPTYIIQGNSKINLNGGGCDPNDSIYPNLRISALGGNDEGEIITNNSGSYHVPVGAGGHTLTPSIETGYYTVSPQSTTVTFPEDSNPYVLDFCVIPAGVFNDLEVQVVPLGQARPGFDATYKILYKNKGTTTLSGDILLAFNDNKMDFQSASIAPSNQTTGQLTWHYSDLAPLTSGDIGFIMKINTPTDTSFPVDSGDILSFTATINPLANEETVEDNTFSLRQEVVNSYDPNDKQCLEGKYVHPDDVGKYIHFMIRFENTGTASAWNVVIKDEIDESRFDMASFKPVNGSHSFVTRIKEGNKLEFIFDNINLPFDDANNDGYVVFKIKTLSSLQLNDVLKNKAEIYFDYNAPIITNEVEVIVGISPEGDNQDGDNQDGDNQDGDNQDGDNQDGDNQDGDAQSIDQNIVSNQIDVQINVNPVFNDLELSSNAAIRAVYVIDIRGRKILEQFYGSGELEVTLDVSALTQGFYLVKVITNERDVFKRIIKK